MHDGGPGQAPGPTRRRLLAAAASLGATGAAAAPLCIGALSGPDAVLWQHLAPSMQAAGRELRIIERNDTDALDAMLAAGKVFGVAGHNTQTLGRAGDGRFAAAFYTITLPTGVYSRRIRGLTQLKAGDVVVFPAEPIERDRGRVLLYNYGLLRARDDDGLDADFGNIVNPRGFALQTEPAGRLAGRLGNATAVVMPYAQAIAAGLLPSKDSIGLEDARSAYAGVLAIRAADSRSPDVALLARQFRSRSMRQFVYDRYGDSVGPTW